MRCPFIEVHLFRRTGRRVEFLCLRRAHTHRLPGVWQPVTGKRRRGETAFAAARREVREETGLEPRRWWALEEPTFLYQAQRDEVIAIPVFAAEIGPRDRVRLSDEHDARIFLPARGAGRRYLWESQRRALEDVRRQVLRGGALADALELAAPPPVAAAGLRRGTRRT
jgi:dihydroneopterin triphosphate diphosphatase